MNYFVAGTNNMEAAIRFYDQLFSHFGIVQAAQTDRMSNWLGDGFAFAVADPFDGKPATHGNGTMIGFHVGAPEQVDEGHKAMLAGFAKVFETHKVAYGWPDKDLRFV